VNRVAKAVALCLGAVGGTADASVACAKRELIVGLRDASPDQWQTVLRRINGPEWTKDPGADATCFTVKARQVCPAQGKFFIWRNRGHDLWVRIDSPADESALKALLDGLGPRLQRAFTDVKEGGYADARTAIVKFSGQRCLPYGYALGSEDGDGALPADPLKQVRALEGAAKELSSREKELERQGAAAAKREAQCTETKTDCPRPDEVTQADEAFKTELERIGKELCTRSAECAEAPPGQAGASGSAVKPEAKGEEGSTAASQVKGSGGILPPGAPPWLVDLLRMILAYFGVDQAVEGAAMALFLLAPDLVNKLAETSAKLTKDFASDDLDAAFKAARELYQLYNAVDSLSKGLEAAAKETPFKRAGAMLKAVGGAIEDLPPSLKQELQNSLSKDLTKYTKLADQLGALDMEDFKAIASGDERSMAALRQRIDSKVRAESKKAIRTAVTNALRDELKLPADIASAVAGSGRIDIAKATRAEVIKGAARSLGVSARDLTDALAGGSTGTRAKQRLATQVAVASLTKASPDVPDPAALVAAAASPTAANVKSALLKNAPGVAKSLDDLHRVANDPRSAAFKAAQVELAKRSEGALSPGARRAIANGAPASEVVAAEIESRTSLSSADLSGKTPKEVLLRKLAATGVRPDDMQRITSTVEAIRKAQPDQIPQLLDPLRDRLEERIVGDLSRALDVAVSGPGKSAPAWIQQELRRLGSKPTEESLKTFQDKIVTSLVASVVRQEQGVQVGASAGCSAAGEVLQPKPPLSAAEQANLHSRLRESLVGTLGSNLPPSSSLESLCRSVPTAVRAWLLSTASASFQATTSRGSVPLLTMLAGQSATVEGSVATARDFAATQVGEVGVPSLDSISTLMADRARSLCRLASTGELCASGKSELSRLIAAAAEGEISDALGSALYSPGLAQPDYVRAARVMLRSVLVGNGPLAGFDDALFAKDQAARRSAAVVLIGAALAPGSSVPAVSALPLTGSSCAAAAAIRIRGSDRSWCSVADALAALMDERIRRIPANTLQVRSSDLVALFLGQPGGARSLVQGQLCGVGTTPCTLEGIAVSTASWVTNHASLARAKGEIELVELVGSGELDRVVENRLRGAADRASGEACPGTKLKQFCGPGDRSCDQDSIVSSVTDAIAECAAASPPAVSASLAATENLVKVRKILALSDCARTSVQGGLAQSDADLDSAARRCRERAGL
jgi:hypothetical protein